MVVVFDFFPVPGACACCCKDDCCWGSVDFGGPPPKAFENDVERLALPPLPPTSVREIALLSRALVFRRSLPVKGPSVVLRIVKKQNDEVWVEIVGLKMFQVYNWKKENIYSFLIKKYWNNSFWVDYLQGYKLLLESSRYFYFSYKSLLLCSIDPRTRLFYDSNHHKSIWMSI